jgi:hypothetical protein
MKKKEKKNGIETAAKVVSKLKATVEISQEKGHDTLAIKALESSVRKIERFKKEIIALKEKLRNKKVDLNQEKELMWDLVKTAKKTMKSKPEKNEIPEIKEQNQKVAKVANVAKAEEPK